MKYKREIDGLRALAVLPVILFHAGFETFSGGFIGVDVFFVISGYLITTILIGELERGDFSVVNFYERRARRILPALSLVMLVSILLAWFWMLPTDMKDFARSLAAVSLFSSNILFWRESGYFDTAAELKPLLHTWSLAVEEQYYIFFPLFLMLAWKLGKRWIALIIAIVAVSSLALAQWGSIAMPAPTFYLLPTRGWELLVGSFTAIYGFKTERIDFGRRVGEIGGSFGLVLILYSIFAYDKTTPFPGLYALAPTVGAALVILFASQQTTVGKFVGNKVFVGIGLISYSAYLWHQPLFVFARYKGLGQASPLLFFLLTISAFLLAYFTWRYVEAPFRNKKRFDRHQIFALSAMASMAFIAFGILGYVKNGFEFRLDERQRALIAFNNYDVKSIYRKGECFLNIDESYTNFKPECASSSPKETIFIWGDSHAAALSFGLRKTFENTTQYTASGCPPILDTPISERPMCDSINKFVASEVARLQPRVVLLHANWLLYEEQKPYISIQRTIDYIHTQSPYSRIIIVGAVPQYYPTLPTYMWEKHVALANDVRLKTYAYDKLSMSDKAFSQLRKNGVEFFSTLGVFCDGDLCSITSNYENTLMPMAWDYGHLTAAGSIFLAKKFKASYPIVGNEKISKAPDSP